MAITLSNENSYPLNGTAAFPIGEEIVLEFNQLVDLKSAKESITLVRRSDNKIVEADVRATPVDANLDEIADNFLTKPASQKCLVTVKPKSLLDANTEYSLFVRGSALEEVQALTEEFSSNTLSERTVFNTSLNDVYTEQMKVYGSYEGSSQENLNIEIVIAGEGSAAKYIWWFDDEIKPQPSGKRLNRTTTRWRSLARGCYIKFYGGTYTLGDTYKVKVYPRVKLESSFRINFSTSSSDLLVKPTSVSESDIGLVLPEASTSTYVSDLRVIRMEPPIGSINNGIDTSRITIYFNKNINSGTVSQSNVRLSKQSVSGMFSSNGGQEKMPKEIIVEDNKIILEF